MPAAPNTDSISFITEIRLDEGPLIERACSTGITSADKGTGFIGNKVNFLFLPLDRASLLLFFSVLMLS